VKKYNGAAFWPPSAQARTLPDGAEMETAVPARPAGIVADLLVPLGQAMVTGALLGGLLVFAVGEVAPGFGGDLFKVWAITALAITAGTWLILLGQTRRLLWAVERLTGLDLDEDGTAGPPEKQAIEVHVRDGRQTRIIGSDWLGMSDDRLILFAAGLVRGRGLTEGEWGRDKAAFPKGINQFRAVRGKLQEAGLIEKVNPDAENSTYRLTAAGRAVFRRLAKLSHAHTHGGGPE
jgi:hypothetical protein